MVPTKIGKRYAVIATPVGTHEALLYKDMALATKFGQQSGQTLLMDAVTDQTIVMTSKPELYSWGVPASSATIVATLKNPTSRATIFHYDVGDPLTDGSLAPSCRGAFSRTSRIRFSRS